MSKQWDAKGKTFLVTGGASGLGALYAEEFLKEGAKNVAILDIVESVGKATAERLNKAYANKVVFIKCDVSNEDDINAAFNEVLNKFKQIDVIINNAGIMIDTPAMWRKACDVNWQGLVSFTMKGVKHMRKDEGGAGGTIINISSVAAIFKFRQLPIYSGSKMAVLHFSQSLAVEPFFEQTGVRILTICFGPTSTSLMNGLRDRCYDEKIGDEFVEMDNANGNAHQKVGSAVAAFVKMFKEGANGSVWLSVNDQPGKDITPNINKAFTEFEKLFLP